jgi:CDP-diacylglycerol--serine O-phosphatidyltransferase
MAKTEEEKTGHKGEGRHRPSRRDIFFLPSLFTTAGLFAGFFAIVQAMSGNFQLASMAIFIAMIADGLDGRVARWTNTQSEFGAEYDSIVDMVAFGVAPSLVMYEWALSGMGKLGWLAAFIYTAGAGLRLARFNVRVDSTDKAYFQGLPSPTAAALLAGFVWVLYSYGVPGRAISILALAVTVAAGVLMVSNIRYRSFKDLDLKGKIPFVALLALPLLYVLITLDPPRVLFGAAALYTLLGPVTAVRRLFRRGRRSGRTRDGKKEEG